MIRLDERNYMYLLPVTSEIAIDIGANNGCYTTILAEKFRKVYAFEPHPFNIKDLKEAVKDLDNVEVMPMAIAEHDGPVKLYENLTTGNSLDKRLIDHYPDEYGIDKFIEVPGITLDTFCRDKKIAFIKCDIEGGEDFIWKSASETLTNNPDLVILLETHKTIDTQGLFRLFESYGYAMYAEPQDVRLSAEDILVNHQYLVRRPVPQ